MIAHAIGIRGPYQAIQPSSAPNESLVIIIMNLTVNSTTPVQVWRQNRESRMKPTRLTYPEGTLPAIFVDRARNFKEP